MIRFLAREWMLLILISVVFGFTLAGCAGTGAGGGAGVTLRLTPVETSIELPTGYTGDAVASLSAWSSGGVETPRSDGKVVIPIFNGGPQYSELRNEAGRLVVAGFLSDSDRVLSVTSTARMLAFFAVGGHTARDEARMATLEQVSDLPGFNNVVTEVENSLRTIGFVDLSEANLLAALEAISDLMIGGGSAPGRALGRGTLVTPGTSASGISLDTTKDGLLTIQNTYLRRCLGWLDIISYKDTNGKVVNASASDQNRPSFEIPMPKRYSGFIGSIGDIITGDLPYSPVNVGPVNIPAVTNLIADSVETKYRLTVGGPGVGTGDFAQLSDARANELGLHNAKSLFLDYIVPFVASVLIPFNGDEIDDFVGFVGSSGALTDLVNTTFQTLPNVKDQVQKGEFWEAFRTIREGGLLSNTIFPVMIQLFIDYMEQSADQGTFDRASVVASRAQSILAILGAVDKFISAGETFVVGADFARSDVANVFTIISTKGKITLVPDSSTYNFQQAASVTAVIQNKIPEAVYRYDWRVENGLRLTDGAGRTILGTAGGTLQSNSETVTVVREPQAIGSGRVFCKVWRIDGEPDQEVAENEVNLTFNAGIGASFEFQIVENKVFVWVLLPVLPGDLWYSFNVVVPKITNTRDPNTNKIISTEFGPELQRYSGSWRYGGTARPTFVPQIINGKFYWPMTSVNSFPETTGESGSSLAARMQSNWGNQPLTATATPAN